MTKSDQKKLTSSDFKESSRKLFDIPLDNIQGNPANYREVIPNLSQMGYIIFSSNFEPNKIALWDMLVGKPEQPATSDQRQEAVKLLEEHEPGIVDIANTIAQTELIHPISVVGKKNKVVIETGMARALAVAFLQAKKQKPPGTITASWVPQRNIDEQRIRAVIENLNRIEHKPIDLAKAFQILRDNGWTLQKIADRAGRTIQTILNYLQLLELPEHLQAEVAEGNLNMTTARDLIHEAEETGEDLEEIDIDTVHLKSKQRRRKRKMLSYDEILNILNNETHPHTIEVLARILQLDPEEVDDIRNEYIITQAFAELYDDDDDDDDLYDDEDEFDHDVDEE